MAARATLMVTPSAARCWPAGTTGMASIAARARMRVNREVR